MIIKKICDQGYPFNCIFHLLRIRKIRVSLRVQVAAASLRGANTLLFRNPGGARESARQVPDYIVSFEVTPRNLNLTR